MKFFLKCEEAVHVCDKGQYKEASFFEKLLLNLHNLMCKLCRKHSKQNTKLTETIKSADLKTLPKTEKNRIHELILKEIKSENQS